MIFQGSFVEELHLDAEFHQFPCFHLITHCSTPPPYQVFRNIETTGKAGLQLCVLLMLRSKWGFRTTLVIPPVVSFTCIKLPTTASSTCIEQHLSLKLAGTYQQRGVYNSRGTCAFHRASMSRSLPGPEFFLNFFSHVTHKKKSSSCIPWQKSSLFHPNDLFRL
jgi:hypothetical protein